MNSMNDLPRCTSASTKRSCDWLIGVPLTGMDGFVTDLHVRILFWVPQVLFLFSLCAPALLPAESSMR